MKNMHGVTHLSVIAPGMGILGGFVPFSWVFVLCGGFLVFLFGRFCGFFWHVFSSGAIAWCFNRLSHDFKNQLIFRGVSYRCRCSLIACPVARVTKPGGEAELVGRPASLRDVEISAPDASTLRSVGRGRCALVWMGSQKALELSTRSVRLRADLLEMFKALEMLCKYLNFPCVGIGKYLFQTFSSCPGDTAVLQTSCCSPSMQMSLLVWDFS